MPDSLSLLKCLVILVASWLLCSCGVTRTEVMATAKAYHLHSWTPTLSNAFHGEDPDGIRVDTPDQDFRPSNSETRPGWWVAGEPNTGIPYQWGGFDTPTEFDRKIARGYFAGDVYTPAKRAGNDSVVSRFACGVDCSGFISRCWGLDRPYSTAELPSICEELSDYSELRPGDLLNKPKDHAMLFAGFADEEGEVLILYETGCPPSWKVMYHTIQTREIRKQGFKPYRYLKIRD